jgi:hypothetical protein
MPTACRVVPVLATIALVCFGTMLRANGYDSTAFWGERRVSLNDIVNATPTRTIHSINGRWAFISDTTNGLALGAHKALGAPFQSNFLFDYRMVEGSRYIGEKTVDGRVVWFTQLASGTPMMPSMEGAMALAPASARRDVPFVAENGDVRDRDNDGDGRPEPTFVRGHVRNGRPVKSHFRALPAR